MSAAAGWYPEGSILRYWDGTTWTNHTAPLTSLPPSPVRPVAPIQDSTSVIATTQPQGYPTAVAAKSPALGVIASFFLPGLGSMINGQVGKGVGLLVGYLVSWILVFFVVGIVGVVGFWVWGMVDGYQGAQKWNARYGIIS